MQNKTITIDDQEFRIGQLSMDQVEEILYGEKPNSNDGKGWNDRAWRTIETSLNNAGPAVDLQPIKKSISFPGFTALHLAILEYSGLKTTTPGEPLPSPAPASISTTSGISSSVPEPVVN